MRGKNAPFKGQIFRNISILVKKSISKVYTTYHAVCCFFALRELKKKREANAERMSEKKRDAESAVELMKETVDRSFDVEDKKGGLVIKKALYGKLTGDDVK